MRRPNTMALAALALLAGLATGCHEVHFEPRIEAGKIGIFDSLFSVAVQDEQHVVAVGYWGAIYVSQDGGNSWTKAKTDTTRLIYGVDMADAKRGWAVGQVGLVLRTEDGGLTWTQQETAKQDQGVHLFSVQALDANRAWAVGEWGTRIYTDDGGKTWQDHSLTIDETHPQFVWLSIPDQERVRAGEMVFEDVGLNDIYCLDDDTQRCWMIGEFGYVFYTDDGGIGPDGKTSWTRGQIVGDLQLDPVVMGYNEIELPEGAEEPIAAFSQEILDEQHLNVAIEPRLSSAEIEKLYDGEDPFPLFELVDARTQAVQTVVEESGILSDRVRRRGAPPWDYEDFLEDDPEFLNRWIESRRAEQPGVEVQIAQNPFLFTIRFATQEQGLISGLGGVVLRSEDGGRTWRYEEVGRKLALFSVQPFPKGRAIVIGEKGFLRVSEDRGRSWQALPDSAFPTLFTYMRDLDFAEGDRVGFIVGQQGKVLRTEDGGKSWTQVLPPHQVEASLL